MWLGLGCDRRIYVLPLLIAVAHDFCILPRCVSIFSVCLTSSPWSPMRTVGTSNLHLHTPHVVIEISRRVLNRCPALRPTASESECIMDTYRNHASTSSSACLRGLRGSPPLARSLSQTPSDRPLQRPRSARLPRRSCPSSRSTSIVSCPRSCISACHLPLNLHLQFPTSPSPSPSSSSSLERPSSILAVMKRDEETDARKLVRNRVHVQILCRWDYFVRPFCLSARSSLTHVSHRRHLLTTSTDKSS